MRSPREAVIRGSFCRRLPAAALRGLANGALPCSTSDALRSANAGDREVDLAAHLEQLGRVVAGQPLGDLADGAHVGGDVLAGAPVAAGGAADQPALLVGQVDRQAVDLELAEELHRAAGVALGALGPGRPARRRSKTLSSDIIRSACSTGVNSVEKVPPTFCVGDSGVRSAGNSLLERLQLAQQPVELGVGDGRRVEHVVAVLMAAQLVAQLGVPGAGLGRRLGARRGLLLGGRLRRDPC